LTRRSIDVDGRLLAAAIAALAAGLLVLTLTRAPDTVEIVTASAPLPPGVAVGSLPTGVARVVDAGGALLAAELEAAAHFTLAARLDAGDPILRSLLVPPSGGRRHVIGLTLRSERAVHGDLVAGDTVAVYGTRDDLPPRRLSSSVLVLAADPGAGGMATGDVAVLLAVDDRLTLDLIRTVHEQSVYLVRTGR
jgi:hypothetical protein